MPTEKAVKAKKVASRRRVAVRQEPVRTYSKREVPSPRTFRKYQAAYEEALKRSTKPVVKVEKKVVKKDPPAVKSRRAKPVATTSVASKKVATSTGGKSAYQKFVQKKMKQADMKGIPATERMKLIAGLWKEEKSKK